MPTSRLRGILVLEQHWTSPLRPDFSVEPLLSLLSDPKGKKIPTLYRRFTTRTELSRLVDEWLKRDGRRFPVLYIAGHGSPGVICLGRKAKYDERVTLDWLTAHIAGRAKGKWIHIGSCETLALDGRTLRPLLNQTGALGFSGYRNQVSFTLASAWELIWLRRLVYAAADRRGSKAVASWSTKAGRGVFSELSPRVILQS